jgi:hypothetical protein
MGVIELEKGRHLISIKAAEIIGEDFIDLRLLVLERLK